MADLYDLEEDFIIKKSKCDDVKILVEHFLRFNSFRLRDQVPPHMIVQIGLYSGKEMPLITRRVRWLQIAFEQIGPDTRMSIKITGKPRTSKFYFWRLLIRLLKYLDIKLDTPSIIEIINYLDSEEYQAYLKERGKLFLKSV